MDAFSFVRLLYLWNLCNIILHSRSFLIRTESVDMPFSMSFVKSGICSYDQYFSLIILI